MYEDTYKLIAARIVEAMEKRDLSYGELASLTDIPKSTLQRYATGDTRKIPLDRIEAIARETNTSTAYLMGWNENEKSPAPEGTEDSDKIKRERSYRLFDALVSAGLIRNDDLVADDINFLFHVLDVIDDWFARKERQ